QSMSSSVEHPWWPSIWRASENRARASWTIRSLVVVCEWLAMWITTSRTDQPSQRDGVAHCSAVRSRSSVSNSSCSSSTITRSVSASVICCPVSVEGPEEGLDRHAVRQALEGDVAGGPGRRCSSGRHCGLAGEDLTTTGESGDAGRFVHAQPGEVVSRQQCFGLVHADSHLGGEAVHGAVFGELSLDGDCTRGGVAWNG